MIGLKFTVNLTDTKKFFFDKCMTEVERTARKNTEIAAAQTRLAAQHSMKMVSQLSKAKISLLKKDAAGIYYSRPGDPPLVRTGLIKRFILYAWDNSTHSAWVGPIKINYRGNVPQSLEHGMPTLIMTGTGPNRKLIEVGMKARPYMVPALRRVMEPSNLYRIWVKSMKKRRGL